MVSLRAIDFSSGSTIWTGSLFVFFSVISGALYPVLIKLNNKIITANILSLVFNFFGLLMSLPFLIHQLSLFGFPSVSQTLWGMAIFYSLASNALYLLFWNLGLKIVPASTASLFTAIIPISTCGLAFVFLGESINKEQMIGASLIILAIFIGVNKEQQR